MDNTPNSLNQLKSSQPSKWDTVSNVDYDPDRAERLSKTPLRRKAEIAKSLIHENQ